MQTILFRGAVYKELHGAHETNAKTITAESAQPSGPQFIPPPPANPPGPTLSLQDFIDMGAMSEDEFAQRAADIAEQMLSPCQRYGKPFWCVALNGISMGQYEDRVMAQKIIEHWLFLKSKMPRRRVHMGAVRRCVVATMCESQK